MRDITDNEIIEFVKYAMYSAKGEDGFKEIYWERFKDILDLINRQKAENERLQIRIGELIRQYNNDIGKAKNEAIKEFAEKLKEKKYCTGNRTGYATYAVEIKDIDNLVKEMEGK